MDNSLSVYSIGLAVIAAEDLTQAITNWTGTHISSNALTNHHHGPVVISSVWVKQVFHAAFRELCGSGYFLDRISASMP